MKNPLEGISLFRAYRVGEVPEQGQMIVVRYGACARAFYGFGEKVVGKASGYGYDKVHTALADAIENLYQVPLQANGAGGWTIVREGAQKAGIVVEQFAGAYGWSAH